MLAICIALVLEGVGRGDLEGMMLSTQNVTYKEAVSTCSFKLLEEVKRLFQIVVSKHAWRAEMLSLVHCFTLQTTVLALLTIGMYAGMSRIVCWSAEPRGGSGTDLYPSETEP